MHQNGEGQRPSFTLPWALPYIGSHARNSTTVYTQQDLQVVKRPRRHRSPENSHLCDTPGAAQPRTREPAAPTSIDGTERTFQISRRDARTVNPNGINADRRRFINKLITSTYVVVITALSYRYTDCTVMVEKRR